MRFRYWLIALMIGALLMGGCGGGSSSNTPGTGGDNPPPGGEDPPPTVSVQLSGTVAVASSGSISKAGKLMPLFGASITELPQGANLANALVLAVDQGGNVTTVSADAAGGFVLDGLKANTVYALVFIDTRTMEVIGSLVQAADTNATGGLQLADNASLGRVVIDPGSKKAVAQADVEGDLPTQNATDTFGERTEDGGIDINKLQSDTLTSGGTLSQISIASFLGDPGTWSISRTSEEYSWEYDGVVYEVVEDMGVFSIARAATVTGPSGSQVSATRQVDLYYYVNEQYGENQPDWWIRSGFIDADVLAARINDEHPEVDIYSNPTLLAAAPDVPLSPQFNIWGWSEYRYIDSANNRIVFGEKEGDEIVWDTFHLPLNVVLGESFSFQEQWEEHDGVVNIEAECTITIPEGALIEDTLGNKLPVVRVVCEETATKGDEVMESGQRTMYFVSKYGAQVSTTDPEQDWAEIIANNVRFGTMARVDGEWVVTQTSPATIGTHDASGVFPGNNPPQNANLAELRNGWLAFVHANRDVIGVWPDWDNNHSWFWVEWLDGQGAVDPRSWDEQTWTSYELTGGSTETFTVHKVHYYAEDVMNFALQFRTWDGDNEVALGDTFPATEVVNATGHGIVENLQFTNVAIPAYADLPEVAQWGNAWIETEPGSGVWEEYQAGHVTLWLILTIGDQVHEAPLEWYTLLGAKITE